MIHERIRAVPEQILKAMFKITINGCENCLVNKRDTFRNLNAVNNGRKWAGVWYGQNLSKCCLFTKEEAEKEVARLSTLNHLDNAFTCKEFTYQIVEVNK